MQKDFIRKCLRKKPEERPTARELLFHPVLFEVHSLKLLAAHILVNTPGISLFIYFLFIFPFLTISRKKKSILKNVFDISNLKKENFTE